MKSIKTMKTTKSMETRQEIMNHKQGTENLAEYVRQLGEAARAAAAVLATASTQVKNNVLLKIADLLDARRAELLAANARDMQLAETGGLEAALKDRLLLNDARIDGMITSVRQVAELTDPIGEISDLKCMPSGIRVGKMRVPLGVVGIIYESRPNVTIDAAILCLKSGNACILRGGSEAFHSNRLLGDILAAALTDVGLPAAGASIVATKDREATRLLISSDAYLDVLIPRGGRGLIEHVNNTARVNVIKHLDGNCHVYVSRHADTEMAVRITVNAKTRRYGVCNAMESLLADVACAGTFLPLFAKALAERDAVELRGCPATCKILPECKPAAESDWSEEYLAPILSVKIVDGTEEAIRHINQYGSKHTDAIITDSYAEGQEFLRSVDSSSVIWNASTGFADGFEYGLGAEVGISTDKFHARGPVGLEGLTCQKFVVLGQGETRDN